MTSVAARLTALVSLRRMADLESNWDSYGSVPIDSRAIERAILMLDSLEGDWTPVPMSDGGVQLELHSGGFDIEIQIRAHPTSAATAPEVLSGKPPP